MTKFLPVLATSGAAAMLFAIGSGAVTAKPRVVENAELKYSVTLPSECRTEQGPGTLEAICSPDFDEAKSAEMATAQALLLELDAEKIPAEARDAYTETEFRQELPESVCGESGDGKTKLSDVKVATDGAISSFSANVICPELKFLSLPERSASVRYVIAPGFRYRLMARSLRSDSDKVKSAADAFLASFKPGLEKKL